MMTKACSTEEVFTIGTLRLSVQVTMLPRKKKIIEKKAVTFMVKRKKFVDLLNHTNKFPSFLDQKLTQRDGI